MLLKGILAALPVMGMTWFLHQEFVRDDLEGTITLASWLLVAVSAVLILRLNDLKAGVLLALGTNILIGLAYAYEGIYFGGTLNFDAPGANWIQVLRSFLPQWVAISTLVLGPLLARQYPGDWLPHSTGGLVDVSPGVIRLALADHWQCSRLNDLYDR